MRSSRDPDDLDTWADAERTRRHDDALDRSVEPVPQTPPPLLGYGSENHPSRKVDRESMIQRIERMQG